MNSEPNFTFQNEKRVNEDLQNLVNQNKAHIMGSKQYRLW